MTMVILCIENVRKLLNSSTPTEPLTQRKNVDRLCLLYVGPNQKHPGIPKKTLLMCWFCAATTDGSGMQYPLVSFVSNDRYRRLTPKETMKARESDRRSVGINTCRYSSNLD